MATWSDIIDECARQLARAKSMREVEAEIQHIEQYLSRNPYPGGNQKFWDIVRGKYREEPKTIIKEAMSAEALNALLAAAEAALKQKAGR